MGMIDIEELSDHESVMLRFPGDCSRGSSDSRIESEDTVRAPGEGVCGFFISLFVSFTTIIPVNRFPPNESRLG
jgi:hypothetical protein